MLPHLFNVCIDACNACATACERCAIACMKDPDEDELLACILMNLDCAPLCRVTAGFMARTSSLSRDVGRLCARTCEECALECEKINLEHCRDCAIACRRCAAECRAIVAQLEAESATPS